MKPHIIQLYWSCTRFRDWNGCPEIKIGLSGSWLGPCVMREGKNCSSAVEKDRKLLRKSSATPSIANLIDAVNALAVDEQDDILFRGILENRNNPTPEANILGSEVGRERVRTLDTLLRLERKERQVFDGR